MNVELLKKIATKLRRLRHKKHFDMNDWAYENECGTAACIGGGHALLMSGYKLTESGRFVSPSGRRVSPEHAARRLLKLTEDQGNKLFSAPQWPVRFGGSGWIANSNKRLYNNPKVAADRIEHFIETKGKE